MSKSAADQYNELIAEFKNTVKRILIFKTDKTRKLPTEEYRILRYKTDLINSYNNFAEFIYEIIGNQEEELQNNIHRDFDNIHKPKLLEALEYLGFGVQLHANFLPIDISLVKKLDAQLPNAQPSGAQVSSVQAPGTESTSKQVGTASGDTEQIDRSAETLKSSAVSDQSDTNSALGSENSDSEPE